MPEIKPQYLCCGSNFAALISEHPENPKQTTPFKVW